MQPTKATKAEFDSILAQHRELRGMVKGLRRFCRRPRPQVEDEQAIAWAGELSRRLVEFHERVYRHFHDEEGSGVLRELSRAYPNWSRDVQTLESDHERLLTDLRLLLDAALLYSENKAPDRPKLRRQTLALLDDFEQHEHEETDLIQQLVSQDLGIGD